MVRTTQAVTGSKRLPGPYCCLPLTRGESLKALEIKRILEILQQKQSLWVCQDEKKN